MTDYRFTRGETFRFVVQPLDDDGVPVDTSDWDWTAVLDAAAPNGTPIRYVLPTTPIAEGGVSVFISAPLSQVLSTLSTYAVSAADLDGNVTTHGYGSLVVQGLDLSGPVTLPPTDPADPYEYETSGVDEAILDETVSALRVVRAAGVGHVVVARPPELEALAPHGVTVQSGNVGDPVRVVISGPVTDPTWSWIPGRAVLLGLDGALTQQQPAGLRQCVVVGMATGVTAIVVRIAQPIWLAD